MSVQRAPNASPIQPMSGAPNGVPPMNTMRYRAATRPRISGAEVSWISPFADVIIVSEDRPSSGSTIANVA